MRMVALVKIPQVLRVAGVSDMPRRPDPVG
jgi:hypothetical protein